MTGRPPPTSFPRAGADGGSLTWPGTASCSNANTTPCGDAGTDARAQAILNVLSDYAVETLDSSLPNTPTPTISRPGHGAGHRAVTALYIPAVTTTETLTGPCAAEKNAIDLFAPGVGQELKLVTARSHSCTRRRSF